MIARLRNLLRGVFGEWMARREQKNPAAIYEAAIAGRLQQYGKLREAAAGVLYMKGKLTRELETKSDDLRRVELELARAIESDDDDLALALIRRRDALTTDVDRVKGEVEEVRGEAEAAKHNLISFQDDIARLRDEKVRMLARWANARARRRLQDTLQGLSLDADIRALEEVREHINRAVAGVQLNTELGKSAIEARLNRLREAETLTAAREELSRLKGLRRPKLLPVVLAS